MNQLPNYILNIHIVWLHTNRHVLLTVTLMVSYCSFNRLNTSTLCRSYFPPVNNIYFTGIFKHASCFLLHCDSWEYCINICIYSTYALPFWFTSGIKMAVQAQCFDGENTEWENTYLDLFPLEYRSNAGVKGGTREHRGNRVGEVQDLLKVRSHVLQKEVTRSNIELCGSSNFILSAVFNCDFFFFWQKNNWDFKLHTLIYFNGRLQLCAIDT